LAAAHISKANCTELVAVNQHNLHTKFSALNEDFSSLNFSLLVLQSSPYGSVLIGLWVTLKRTISAQI